MDYEEQDLYQITNALFPATHNDASLAALVRDALQQSGVKPDHWSGNGNDDLVYLVPEPTKYALHQLGAVRDYLSGATAELFGDLIMVGIHKPTMQLVAFAVENLNQAELDGDMAYFENEDAVILAQFID